MAEELKCQDCGKTGPDVKECFCPFSEEINGTKVESVLCDACYQERVWEI